MAEKYLGTKIPRKAITTGTQGETDRAMFERRFKAKHVLSVVTGRGVRDRFLLEPVTDPKASRFGHEQKPFVMTENLTIGIQDQGTETVNYDSTTLTDWYV